VFGISYLFPDKIAFWRLAAWGGKLRQFYLLEGPEFEKIEADPSPVAEVSKVA
jgi:hypothetical protein